MKTSKQIIAKLKRQKRLLISRNLLLEKESGILHPSKSSGYYAEKVFIDLLLCMLDSYIKWVENK